MNDETRGAEDAHADDFEARAQELAESGDIDALADSYHPRIVARAREILAEAEADVADSILTAPDGLFEGETEEAE